jgi:nickel-dependent lactate racemase
MAPPEAKPASIEGSAGLEALRRATAGRRVIVLVPDGTRAQASRELIDPLFRALRSTRALNVAIATGSHRADTEANRNIGHAMREAARAGGAPLSHVTVHDCRSDPFGSRNDPRGTPILFAVLDTAEQFIVVADVKHHYFAGYPIPLSSFYPAYRPSRRSRRITARAGAD